MKSARLSKFLKLALLSVTAIVFHVPPSLAQDSGYAPPPMFDDMTPPMVRPESNNGYIVEPKASPNTELPPETPNAKPVILPRVSPAPGAADSPRATTAPVQQKPVVAPPAPVPPKKMQPIIDPKDTQVRKAPAGKPVEKPAVKAPVVEKPKTVAPVPPQKPVAEKAIKKKIEAPSAPAKPETPVEPVKKPAENSRPTTTDERTAPIKRDPKESAIKGPKTMPALPTEDIVKQNTFQAEKPAEERETQTIMERHKRQTEEAKKTEQKKEPVAVKPKADVPPASFQKGEQGAMKRTIPFAQGQIGLSSEEINPVAVAVTQELDREGQEEWRVQIKAYATPYGTGVSSDKRIALSRALSLRTALIEQGVPAARIDVLAEGQQSGAGDKADRIDLYLYGPESD